MIQSRETKVRSELIEDGRILRVVLDAGRGNVIDSTAIGEMREALAHHVRHHGLHGWILDHEGPHFSFGASVEEHAPGRVEKMLPRFHGLVRDIVHLDLPFLACVRGACLGGGFEIALLADRVFASPSAVFGQPELKLGVFAPLGTLLLPRIIGPRRAAELLFSGRSVAIEEARAYGLASEVAEDPQAAARAWATEHLLPKSAQSLRHATRLLRRDLRERVLPALEEAEHAYLGPLMATRDAREGIAAFLEKRNPVWEDR